MFFWEVKRQDSLNMCSITSRCDVRHLPSSFSYIWTASSCPDLRQGKGYQIPGPVEIVPHISQVLKSVLCTLLAFLHHRSESWQMSKDAP